ncbi:hypothetical protein E3N88_27260 [Mikania micrantha]|uniref:Integrase catalytic domain-containing protein n=1 Tax=Mikania micrantha TaxID=192012 RepID=A0A5N6MW65_9ASTR|nr:hypothetical protein E3N88_27260 [Mikania micrantha]
MSGARYFLSIIDDFSRRVWVYVIKHKSDTFNKFKEWKVLIENQTGRRIKKLRSENGLEFCNDSFNQFCKENGIARHLTVPGTPQQNGLAERMNRTLLVTPPISHLWHMFEEMVVVTSSQCGSSSSKSSNQAFTSLLMASSREEMILSPGRLRVPQSTAKKILRVARRNPEVIPRDACRVSRQFPRVGASQAVMTAAYLVNRWPSSAIGMKCPMEKWSSKVPGYEHLRVFGSLCYAHVNQGKLEPRAQKCIMLGYPVGVKGYRLLKLEGGGSKVIVSRDVVAFREALMYKDVIEQKNQTCESFEGDSGVHIEVEKATGEAIESNERISQVTQVNVEQPEYNIAVNRPRRNVIPPIRYKEGDDLSAFVFNIAELDDLNEPLNYYEAINSVDKEKWVNAMMEEMDSLHKTQTWQLVDRPNNQKLVDCKWIYKLKEGIEGVVEPRYKARLVAKGFTQREGIDYTEIFSPVVKHTSIRVMLAITVVYDLELEQLDVKTAFLHGVLDEQIYMKQPLGFVKEGEENKVCLLKKSLYGLKQSPRQWYRRFDECMIKSGFIRSNFDSCVYTMEYVQGKFIYLLLYVDEMLIACEDIEQIGHVKKLLMCEFDMKELGPAKKILGIEIERDRVNRRLYLTQKSYIRKVLLNYSMENSKPVVTPLAQHFKLSKEDCPVKVTEVEDMKGVPYSNAVGSLMYLMVCTRPDIGYAVSVVSRFLANPGKMHWKAVKWIMRYLNGTKDLGLIFGKTDEVESMVMGSMVSWKATLQHVVALSTTESEYIALTEAVKEAIWLKGFVSDLGFNKVDAVVLCDSQGAVQLSKNQRFHERTKHINVKLHFIREVIESKEVYVEQIDTTCNAADMFTKSLSRNQFQSCLNKLGIG